MSATDPSAIPKGYAALIQNGRIQTGPLIARDGDATVKANIATGTVRGAFECVLNGTQYLLSAIATGGLVSVYASTDGGGTWNSITPTSGPYGDTRLTDSSSVPIRFAVVKDRPFASYSAYDLLVIQNGVDSPRIYGKATSLSTAITPGTAGMSAVTQPTQPLSGANSAVITGFRNYLQIGNASVTTWTNTGSGMVGADAGASATDNYGVLTLTSSGFSAGTSTVSFSVTANFSESKQLILLADNTYYGTDPLWYQKLTLTATDSDGTPNTATIYDPTTGAGSVTAIPVPTPPYSVSTSDNSIGMTAATRTIDVGSGTFPEGFYAGMWVNVSGFTNATNNGYFQIQSVTPTAMMFTSDSLTAPVDEAAGNVIVVSGQGNDAGVLMLVYQLPSGVGSPAPLNWSSVKKITFGFTPAPEADQVINVYMIAGSGKTQGGANFAISAYSSDTRQESPALVLTQKTEGGPEFGGGTDNAGYIKIVEDPRVFYDYAVYVPTPTTAQKNAGIDYVIVYRNDFGTQGYYYTTNVKVASYSGSWGFSGGTGPGQAVFVLNSGGVLDQSKDMLDTDYVCLQVGTAMAASSSRFFSTALEGGAISRLYYSKVDRQFAFRKFIQQVDGNFVDNSGGSFVADGQIIQAIVPIGSFAGSAESLGTPTVGSTTLFVLTNTNAYMLSGFDALSLNRPIPKGPYGTLAPLSVARSLIGFYFLDQRGQVRFYDGTYFRPISVNMVDNKTIPIPGSRKVWVSGAAANESYYMGYSPVGQTTNTNCLVWNERLEAWESEDTFSGFTAGFIIPAYNSVTGLVRLLVFDTVGGNGACYEYLQPTNTNNVLARIRFAEFGDSELLTVVNGIGVQSTKPSGSITYTTRRTTKGGTSGDLTNPVDGTITVTGTGLFMWWWDPEGIGVEAATVQPEVFGTIPGGTVIYRIYAEVDTGNPGIGRIVQ